MYKKTSTMFREFFMTESTSTITETATMPQILIDIVNELKEANITISENVEGEGRGGSLKDEGTIKRWLMEHPVLSQYVEDLIARKAGDILVKDYDSDMRYLLNIKTTRGSSDNATSMIGLLYAFTDMTYEELPGSITLKKFYDLHISRKADIPNKDYYYLCVDKNDPTNVICRGAKQIACWVENANRSNMLQINWAKEKEHEPVNRTYDEAYEVIINGIVRCLQKAHDSIPDAWKPE